MYSGLVPIPLQDTTPVQMFRVFRIASVTRPELAVGLLECFGSFTRSELESITAADLGFFVNDEPMLDRGEERHGERFVIQASDSLGGPWANIKEIAPLPGGPDYADDDWGQCLVCEGDLTEGEAALNDVCEGCRPEFYAEWQDEQDRRAEEEAEARWIM